MEQSCMYFIQFNQSILVINAGQIFQTGEPENVYQGHTDGVQCIQVVGESLYSGYVVI
jgi:ABC-type Fe3+/spermidine/putrescine transport system ATPase subunit